MCIASFTLFEAQVQGQWCVSLLSAVPDHPAEYLYPTQMHPPIMDMVTVTAMLYRFCKLFNL